MANLLLFALLLIGSTCFVIIYAPPPVPEDDTVLVEENYCPQGWSKFGSRCFQYHAEELDWWEAEDVCKDSGGHLASVHSKEENDFVSELALNYMVWIGGTQSNGKLKWLDETPVNYNEWGREDLRGGSKGVPVCLQIYYKASPTWHNVECKDYQGFVCARDSDGK